MINTSIKFQDGILAYLEIHITSNDFQYKRNKYFAIPPQMNLE